MRIHWFGHACFCLTTTSGTVIIMDPFNEKVGYPIPEAHADGCTVSHEHFDHNHTDWIQGSPIIIRGSGDHQIKEVKVTGITSFHDEVQGAKRGPNTIFTYEAEGLRLCHLGDLGHPLTPEQIQAIGPVDILFIPVGGVYTVDANGAKQIVDQIKPQVVVPMHYKTPALSFELGSVDSFSQLLTDRQTLRLSTSEWDVSRESLPTTAATVIFAAPKVG